MTLRPCLDCGTPAPGSRCPACQSQRDARTDAARGNSTDRGYDAAWQRLSARARRLQPFCTDCGTNQQLTADHLRWPARTLAAVQVVCQPCNNRRGAARGPRSRRPQTWGVNPHAEASRPPIQAKLATHFRLSAVGVGMPALPSRAGES